MSFCSFCTFTPILPHSPHYFAYLAAPSPSAPSLILHGIKLKREKRILAASTHSNAKILKTNRRSPYGEQLSAYDSDEEDVDVCLDDESDDEDESFYFSDEEFAEPASLDRGRQRERLLAASRMRKGSHRHHNSGSGLEAKRKGKPDGNKSSRKKYSELREEFIVDTRWIPLLDYLSSFGLSESNLIQMYGRHKPAFRVNLCSAKERLEYLMDVGIKEKDIKKILLRQPQILEYTVESNLKSHVAFLVELGIPDYRLGQVITAAPSLFSYSVENSLKPTIRYLVEEVGIQNKDLCKVVQLSPQVLVQQVDIAWNEKYDFMVEELGATRDNMLKMVTKHSQLLHYSIEDGFLPRIDFLRSIGMGNPDIMKVLTSLTQVLSLSLERNLKPKYMYLVNELKNEVQSLTKYPMYLSLSFDQRIRPRHRFLVFLKKAPDGPFPLSYLVPTDDRFCQRWAATSVDKYLAFRQRLLLDEFAEKYERQK